MFQAMLLLEIVGHRAKDILHIQSSTVDFASRGWRYLCRTLNVELSKFRVAIHDSRKGTTMKPKEELQDIIDQISSDESPVGMDAVYVHALILDKLTRLEERIENLERKANSAVNRSAG